MESSQPQSQQPPKHAPYAPQIWSLGGQPTKGVDIPVTAVFLVLFIIGAAAHMTIFQRNKKRGHLFVFNGLLFGFCMARITTSILRIASICLPHDIPLLIAAQIFTAAGVVLIFVINLFFTQRILRAQHPHLGWHRLASAFFTGIYVLIALSLIMLITAVVQTFYTLNRHIRNIDRSIQLYGVTLFASVAFLPLPLLAASLLIPREKGAIDKFGTGRLRHNIAIVVAGTVLLCLGASYRAGTQWLAPVPRKEALPWYFSRTSFYVFNFGLEIIVVYFYALVRVDQRFHVPDGAKGPGSYSRNAREAEAAKAEGTVAGGPSDEELQQRREQQSLPKHSVDGTTVGGASAHSLQSEERDVEKGM